MRVDPESVYLELDVAATLINIGTGKMRTASAAILHWKDGRKWHRRTLAGGEGETLGDVLRGFAGYVDEHGLDELLAKAAAQ